MSPHCSAIGYRLELANTIKRAQEMAEILFPHAERLIARLVGCNAIERTTSDRQEENRMFAALNNMAKVFSTLLMKAELHGNTMVAAQLSRLQKENIKLLTHIGNTIIQLDNMKGATR